jgi:hypothetical protein
MTTQNRIVAARAYVEALRSGERAAAQAAAPHLATDIVVKVGQREFTGHDEALKRITGVWPLTPVYRKGTWSDPRAEADSVAVSGKMAPVGAGPTAVNLTFWFNDADQISRVEQENQITQPLVETDVLPDFVKERVNNALANDTPICVSYVDEQGRPHLSLRGSTQVFSDTQLSIWARTPKGLGEAIAKNPNLTLLYRDNVTRSTLVFQGKARLDPSDAVRRQVFEDSPEVEQNHESWTSGVAVIIDLEQVDGGTPEGRVRLRRGG